MFSKKLEKTVKIGIRTKKEIKNLPKSYDKNEYIFHAGTTEIDGKVFTNGGRVLNSTVSLPSMKASRDRAIELLNQVVWENKYFRKDLQQGIKNYY